MRFFTVPDSAAARTSIAWAVALIGAFFLMTMVVGVGARAILGAGAEEASAGGNLATPLLAEELGGGAGTTGGDLFLAFISAVAFATILAVVAGLVIAASGAVAHDLWTGVKNNGVENEKEEVRVARFTAVGLGVVAILVSIAAGEKFNVSILIGLAFAVAASANLPPLLCTLFWPRFNTTGAVAGVIGGLTVAVALIIMSPQVWPGPDGEGSPVSLTNPAIISIPAGFLFCFLGTLLSREKSDPDSYHELFVRSEVGLGAAGSRDWPASQFRPRSATIAAVKVAIVGAGFSGIAMGMALRRDGVEDFTIFERGPDLGGVWQANHYPGSACDVPSYLYSSGEQRRDWTRPCSPQQEILDYLHQVADKNGCRPDPHGHRDRVRRVRRGRGLWHLRTTAGEEHDAEALVVACGQLSRPSWPSIPGRDEFAGHSFHSAEWDHDYDTGGQARGGGGHRRQRRAVRAAGGRGGRRAGRLSALAPVDACRAATPSTRAGGAGCCGTCPASRRCAGAICSR